MLDFKKLQDEAPKIRKRAREERLQNLSEYIYDELIQLLETSFVDNELIQKKQRIQPKQSSRVLNNWQKEGIINFSPQDEGKWRKFNKVETIWLDIVSQLRDFGLPLSTIKLVKNQLFESSIKQFSPFEYSIIHCILKEPIILLIYSDGKINLMPLSQYNKQINIVHRAHLYINLFQLIVNVFPNNKFDAISPTDGLKLSNKELKLLYYLRTGNYDWIKVNMRGGDIYLIEANRSIDPESKVADIIRNHSYQSIEIKTENYNKVSMTTTEKVKV